MGMAPTPQSDGLELEADVLVIGGGLAGAWAASAAAREGASVILADKGYCGTSGVTATAGPGHWWVPPDPPQARVEAVRQRNARALGLADPEWMERVIDQTWRALPTLAGYYDFTPDDDGVVQYRGLRGPEYMRALRRLIEDLGVFVLDQSPALELLLRADASVGGAAGWRRQAREPWRVRAGAVVLATGGCAFKSRLLGCHTNTGDGHLMAAEAGAVLSGMEFSAYYTVAPARTTMTRSMSYTFARYFDADRRELDIAPGPGSTEALARALLKGPVFCSLDRTPADIREVMSQVQPNFVLTFARDGIDPYTDLFEVTLRGEGTVRGVGGLRVAGEGCQTDVAGLFVAGDTASREPVAGATSGGGAQNSAWALSTGIWAGQAAAELARRDGVRADEPVSPAGQAGLRPAAGERSVDARAVIAAVQNEMLPYDKNLFRTGGGLTASLDELEDLWGEVRDHAAGKAGEAVRTREAAALVAVGRWCYAAALARTESRGMHQRLDLPSIDARLTRRQVVGGLDRVWTRFERPPARTEAA